MKALVQEKEKAIELRKKGYSYRDILKEIPVAKSSLSVWLKDLPLTSDEKQSLKKRTDANISKGRIRAVAARRQGKLQREKELWNEAHEEFHRYLSEPLFLTGVTLYWAEGAKRNSTFLFVNSDVEMIEVMVRWIERFAGYRRDMLGYRLYIHAPYAHERCEERWANTLNVSVDNFKKTIYKPSGLGVKKRPQYQGCLRIEVPRSTQLLQKMKFWQNMLVEYYKEQ